MSTIEPTPEVIAAPAPATPWFKRKRYTIPGAILVLVVIGSAMSNGDKPKTPAQPGAVAIATAAPTQAAPPPAPAPAPEPTYDTPKAGDFAVKVKVTSKHCFGSAGCNVQVKTSLAVGGVSLDPSVAYELTYELIGDEDGPVVETMRVQGDQYTGGKTSFLSTPTSGTKITARITSVEQE